MSTISITQTLTHPPARDLFDLTYANEKDVADPANTAERSAFFAYQRTHAASVPMNRRELRKWWKKQEKQEKGGG